MKYYKTFFFVLLLASCTSGTKSDDNRQNVKLLWRNPNLEWITSSQLIKNSTIYFGSFNGKFYSADIANGEPKLQFQTGGDPYYLPIVNNNRIIFSSFDLNIYCIDTLGSLVWKIPTEDRIKNDLIEDDSLFFASVRGDGLHALRKSDGSAVWHLDQSSSSFSTSQPIMHLDKIYVGAWDEKVLAINKKSGQVIWTTEYPEYSSSAPAISPMGLIISIDKYYEVY